MAELKLKFASWNYDRIRGLIDKSVRPEGIELEYLNLPPWENFPRMLRNKEFEVGELGFTYYVGALGLDDPPFIAIPVFPLRMFAHSLVYVNKNSGIRSPKDLIGKNVGELFRYGHDAGIWSKGMLSDEYGLPVDSVTYYIGALEGPTTPWDWVPYELPAKIRIHQLARNQSLDRMLEAGEIAALYSAMVPPSLLMGSRNVGYLFEDYETVEREYFRKTGIFPINHLVVIRKDVYRNNPWVARSLYLAFRQAKDEAAKSYKVQNYVAHRLFMVPWLTAHLAQNRELMGEEPWPYGLEPNRKALETFLRYHHEHGLSKRRFEPEELFAPETLAD